MPKKKATPKKPQTKTSVVLGFPRSMPAKQVVEKAKAQGVSLSENLVYAVRSDAKKRKGGKTKTTSTKTTHATSRRHHAGGHKAEDLLKAVASTLGLPHALSILQAEYEKVRKYLGG